MSVIATVPASEPGQRKLIAPLWHTLGLLLLIALPLASGIYLRTHGGLGNQTLSKKISPLYFSMRTLLYEFLLIGYTWWGVRRNGLGLRELIGGRWKKWTAILADAGLGLGFLIAFQVILQFLARAIGQDAKDLSAILPRTALEKLFWVFLSITAGFVEETVFRGYLQTQLGRFGAPTALAILSQALIFGAGHSYEGWHSVIFISFFGLVAGLLAAWRKSLRPGIIWHALTDLLVLLQRAS